MHRFYLPPEQCQGAALTLTGREAHHALHVLRITHGETVTVLDGVGNVFACEVESCSHDTLALNIRVKQTIPPPPCSITLLQAIPKGKIIESLIQKAVELGAHRIVPMLAERVTTRLDPKSVAEKRDKWQQVAVEAIKQCGAPWLPGIEMPQNPAQFIERREQFDLVLVASLQPERYHPKQVLGKFQQKNGTPPKTVGVWVGPEGDFTPDELKLIINAGAVPISLGRLVLRVETAAVYCLSVLNYELNSGLEFTL